MIDFLDFLNNLVLDVEGTSQTSAMDMMQHYQYAQGHTFDLSTQDIVDSVHNASAFFNIDMPESIQFGEMTGVCTHLASVMGDDILYVDPIQMTSMGITDQQAFDLVMTHEGAHRALQGIETNFTDHQEELCCDMMAGVRAGLNPDDLSMDAIDCMKASLAGTLESDTHPAGAMRVDIIDKGVKFGQEYYAQYHCPPSLYECIDHFNELQGLHEVNDIHGLVTLRPDDAPESVKAYSAEEIEARALKAEQEMNYWKSQWENHLNNVEDSMWHESEVSHADAFHRNYEEARQAFLHWSHETPDIAHEYSSSDMEWLEDKVRTATEHEQGYWLEKLKWAKAHALDMSEGDVDALHERVDGLKREEQDDDRIKGYSKVCPTRHGCSGASSCDCSYGDYPW